MRKLQATYMFIWFSMLFVFLVACNQQPEPLSQKKFTHKDIIQAPVVINTGDPAVELLSDHSSPEIINLSGKPPPIKRHADFFITMQNFNTDHGLALSSILCSFKDKAGNLWFGTSGNGVSRFDGKTFTNFSSANGLAHNLINSITEDSHGNIWFGTYGGISKYDGFSFKNFTTANGLPNNNVNKLLEDRQGNIWVTTINRLCRFLPSNNDTTTQRFIQYNEKHGFKGTNTSAIIEDRNGNIWVSSDRGVMKYDVSADSIGKVSFSDYSMAIGLESASASCIVEDRDGLIWFGTDQGVFRFDPVTAGSGNSAFIKYTTDDGLVSNKITSVLEDSEGMIWFGSKAGVSAFRKDDASFFNLTSKQGLVNNSVICITEDDAGSIWFGTIGGGLSRFEGINTLEYTQNQGLIGKAAFSMAEDPDGNLWFGVQENGITKLEFDRLIPNNDAFIQYTSAQGLSVHDAMTMIFSKNGHLWFGSGNGLSRFDGKSITTFTTRQGMVKNNVISLKEDRKGNIWVGTYEGGFSRFDGNGFVNFNNEQGLVNNTVWNIHEDKEGVIWLATRGGLSRFDGKRFINFTKEQGLPDNKLSIVTQDRFGNLLIGSWGGGVSVIRKSKLEELSKNNYAQTDETIFENFNTANGLANDVVYGILEDNEGNIMIGTSNGLTVLKGGLGDDNKIARHGIEVFNQKTGYPIKDVSNNYSMLIDSRGFIWLGTGDKLVRFDYRKVRKTTAAPHVLIQKIRINNENIGWQSLKKAKSNDDADNETSVDVPAFVHDELSVFERKLSDSERDSMLFRFNSIRFDGIRRFHSIPENLVLPFSLNTIGFDFVGIETTRPFLIQYQYILEGFDNQWSVSGRKSTAEYRNLPKGKYTFKVKARSPDGVWSDPIAYSFEVLSPWWLTWWAVLSYVLAFLLILLRIRRYELNRIRLRNQLKLEKVKSDSLRNLDQMKSQFYTNISHEFRTPLTLILGQIESVMSSGIDNREKGKLQVANRNSRRLLKLINELLDLSKLEAGSMELYAENNNIVSFLKNLFFSFESLAADKKIAFTFESVSEKIVVFFDTGKMEKVFYNLISNAFKFTQKNGEIIVKVGFADDHSIEIYVKDSGCGIPEDKLENIFDRFYQVDDSNTREHEGTGIGLALAKELVLLHKGNIRVNSHAGFGTEFIVTLPFESVNGITNPVSDTMSLVNKTYGLPADSVDISTAEAVVFENQLLKGDKKIILIVEDNSDVRTYIREQMEDEYQTLEAQQGELGLKMAREKIPDLIVTDVMMPKMDGFEFCRAIRMDEKTSHIPMIMLTAKSGLDDKIVGLESGVDAYMTKPFSAKELKATVINLLNQRLQLRKQFSKSMFIKPSEVSVNSADQVFLGKIIQAIESNFGDEQFSVEMLAKNVNMSVTQLSRKLNALIDQPPGQLIRSFRLQRAAGLLKQKAGSVSEICYTVGFSDNAYFSRAFKKQFGCSPSEYADSI
jgi:signal transduction histidine kinase/ligand-binding sensor domain-containing protein/DNA-binding response OmpR family regulator